MIRAAARIVSERDIVVIGSQAILGEHPNAPAPLRVSTEADVYPRAHPERAVEIHGAIGEGSQFHETYGYYAHGVGPETAKAPAGWQQRLVPIHNANTDGATGWCLETHDLVLAKLAAGRQRDIDFARVAIAHQLVNVEVLLKRAEQMPPDCDIRASVAALADPGS